MSYRAHLTLKSRNAKVGPIPVSTTESSTCPNTCPLKKSGCYADGGPLAMFWGKVDKGQAGTDWDSFVGQIKALPDGQLWRHNQAGDLPSDGSVIDYSAFKALVDANKGKRGFTYTHHVPSIGQNSHYIERANAEGFTVNLSANNMAHADALMDHGIAPVVVVVSEDHPEHSTTLKGHRVVVCPEQTGKAESCATCGLCQKARRSVIVAFRAHGVSKRKAIKIALAA